LLSGVVGVDQVINIVKRRNIFISKAQVYAQFRGNAHVILHEQVPRVPLDQPVIRAVLLKTGGLADEKVREGVSSDCPAE